jgi:hypothetical protein
MMLRTRHGQEIIGLPDLSVQRKISKKMAERASSIKARLLRVSEMRCPLDSVLLTALQERFFTPSAIN